MESAADFAAPRFSDHNHNQRDSGGASTTNSIMEDEYGGSKGGKFRFKSKPTSGSKQVEGSHSSSNHRRHRHSRHRHHHHSDKRHKSSPLEPSPTPDAAFRESLFDALADDEGAAYWESVYGQPIHIYPRPDGNTDGRGKLEHMSDEEYASYVRARMWAKSHEGIMEGRKRRQQSGGKEKQEQANTRRMESAREAFERMVEESLQRGKERQTEKRKANSWIDTWKRYLDSWDDLDARARPVSLSATPGNGVCNLRNLIFWPVKSGKRKDIDPQAIQEFMRNAPKPRSARVVNPPVSQGAEATSSSRPFILTVLKAERVRWHPDKIQHRYGALGVDEQLIKGVKEVFQILDQMWSEERARHNDG